MTAAIKSSIDLLKKAQEFDREMYQATRALQEEIPQEKAHLERQLEQEKAHLKTLEDAFKALHLKQKQREGVLAEKEANIKKLNGQLGQVKTNKEYAALQQEIASLKADNSILEEEIIKIFDEVEAADEEVKKERERVKKIEKDFVTLHAALIEKEKKSKDDVVRLKTMREEILSQIPQDVRERYDQIVIKRQGMAMAKVNGENCGACQLLLRPQILNEIRLAETLVLCENCTRILYFEE
ncbi:MAG: hypothetical protein EXS63_04945 [Candidatus Omnitrophica bacterium]|nr:hypothetical protein [Candidatus Omnitrophota bacterium]